MPGYEGKEKKEIVKKSIERIAVCEVLETKTLPWFKDYTTPMQHNYCTIPILSVSFLHTAAQSANDGCCVPAR